MPRRSLATLWLSVILLPVLWGFWSLKRPGPAARETTILVRKGATVEQVARNLEREGVIRSARFFMLWAHFKAFQVPRGEYLFVPKASLHRVADQLRRGEIHTTSVSLVPGMHAWSLQRKLKDFIPEERFWELWRDPALVQRAGFPKAESLEGLLAPATYKLHHALEPEEILQEMVDAFRTQVRPKLDEGALPPYETLVLASLVEKETRLPEEQPKVAGVYLKRLSKGMRLQCDPTSQYARWLTGDLDFSAPKPADIHRSHRFNTYAVSGLPPTPIALPGLTAIAAAQAPEVGQDLFFVATGQGGHRFAPDLSGHNRNVSAYRRELKRQRQPRKQAS